MKELNQLRLLAGICIDPSIEVTEKNNVTESVRLNEAASDAALNDFWVVHKAEGADTKLGKILHRTNTQGLAHMLRDADDGDDGDLLIFAGADKVAATKEAKKRIRNAQKAAVEAEEAMFFAKAEQEYEEECEYTAATTLAADDGDGQMSENEEDFEPATNICPDCMEQGGPADPDCERCNGEGEIFEGKKGKKPDFLDVDDDGDKKESMDKAEKDKKKKKDIKEGGIETVVAPITWGDKKKKAVNSVDLDGKTNKSFKDTQAVDSDELFTDAPEGDKDESPTQLDALDTPSQQDQSGGGDHERKITVPADIKKQLKDEAAQARKEGKNLNVSNRDASYFYDDLAQMFDDLHAHLEGGTVYDIKKAQIFMTSLMGPMLHKIPADVVNFLAKGGQQRSLKSYMSKVDAKYPITGPRNAIS